MNGWYKALEDRIWLTQLGLNILLPLVLCLGGCWWAGLDFNRGPRPLRRKNPKKPRRGFVAHHFGTKVWCVIPLCSRGQLRGAVPPCSPDNKVPLQGSRNDKERLAVCA